MLGKLQLNNIISWVKNVIMKMILRLIIMIMRLKIMILVSNKNF